MPLDGAFQIMQLPPGVISYTLQWLVFSPLLWEITFLIKDGQRRLRCYR